MQSNPQVFRQPHFGFVEDFFQTGKAGKGKAVDGDGADFAYRRLLKGRTTAFFVNQDQHQAFLIANP